MAHQVYKLNHFSIFDYCRVEVLFETSKLGEQFHSKVLKISYATPNGNFVKKYFFSLKLSLTFFFIFENWPKISFRWVEKTNTINVNWLCASTMENYLVFWGLDWELVLSTNFYQFKKMRLSSFGPISSQVYDLIWLSIVDFREPILEKTLKMF